MITREYILKSVEKSIRTNANGREHRNKEVEKYREFYDRESDDEVRKQLKEFDAVAQFLPLGFIDYIKNIY